jgi:hypothetical protein
LHWGKQERTCIVSRSDFKEVQMDNLRWNSPPITSV